MRKKINLIVIILLCLFVTGCKPRKNFETKIESSSYADRQMIVPSDFNVNGTGELMCRADATGPENSTVDIAYNIIYKNGNIKSLQSLNRIKTIDKEVLDTYYNSYVGIAKNYNGLKYYETLVEREDDSVSYNIFIDYDKIDVDKLLEIEGKEDNIIVNGKANLDEWLHFAEKFGILCEEV